MITLATNHHSSFPGELISVRVISKPACAIMVKISSFERKYGVAFCSLILAVSIQRAQAMRFPDGTIALTIKEPSEQSFP
jgi:hypothetical protein